jgi:transcriptional regulator of acetoin/glycerol metabolism
MTLLERSHEDFLGRVAPDLVRPLAIVRRDAIESAMILCQGNVTEAARRLEISRYTLHRLLRQWRKEDA